MSISKKVILDTGYLSTNHNAELQLAIYQPEGLEGIDDCIGLDHDFDIKLANILDTTIEGHKLWGEHKPFICADSKPLFDFIRSNLIDLIAKIDQLQFKKVKNNDHPTI